MQKRFTVEQKLSAIKDYESGKPISEICRKYGVNPNSFYKWKEKYAKSGVDGLAPKNVQAVSSKESELQRENDQLKKLIGEKELALNIYKDLLKKTNPGLKLD